MIFITCVVLTSLGIWRVGALTGFRPSANNLLAQDMDQQIQRGIGSQVRFASRGSSVAEVRASVQSAGNFIYARSGFRMSPETENRIVALEKQTLDGERRPIKVSALVDTTTAIALDHIATLSDQEIDDVVKNHHGSSPRTTTELKAARDRQRNGDLSVQYMVLQAVQQKIDDRLSVLGRAMPEQFGRATTEGVTPMQGLLLVYSIASDDLMAGSVADLRVKAAREQAADRSQQQSIRPYGPKGYFASTRMDLILTRENSRKFLDRIEKEGRQ